VSVERFDPLGVARIFEAAAAPLFETAKAVLAKIAAAA